eukprot:6862308-Pyramimonas_sp.AAC.1
MQSQATAAPAAPAGPSQLADASGGRVASPAEKRRKIELAVAGGDNDALSLSDLSDEVSAAGAPTPRLHRPTSVPDVTQSRGHPTPVLAWPPLDYPH